MNKIKLTIKNFLWRLTLKYLVNPNKIVKINSNKMYLDSKDSLLLSLRKNYEPKHVELMKSIVKEGDIVMDIGAHIGYYTLILAEIVGPKGKVYAFEPNPENFKVLQKNIEINGYKNVILEKKAISDKNGTVNFYFSDLNTGDGRIYTSSEKRTSCEVECIKLDDYFKNIPKPSFFKIDIQGIEILALKGMSKIMNNPDIKFTTEFQPEAIEEGGHNPQDFLNEIRKKDLIYMI
jgi:FkbM family methyltransferase